VIVILAALMAAQAPAEVQPDGPGQPVEVTGEKRKKPKQKCQYVEVSGSRMRQRVCHDDYGTVTRGPNVTDAGVNPGMLHAPPGPFSGGLGPAPK
jgi:hypothetical protein